MPQLAFLPDSQRSSGHRPLLCLLLPVWFPLSKIFISSQNIHNTLKTTCKHNWAACWCMSIPEICPAPFTIACRDVIRALSQGPFSTPVFHPTHCPSPPLPSPEEARGRSSSAAAMPHSRSLHFLCFRHWIWERSRSTIMECLWVTFSSGQFGLRPSGTG